MFNYDKRDVVSIAKSNDFIVNNTEKVLRLSKVLSFINKTKYGDYLCLKGGTAINLFLLNLSRLSVDIDYDFSLDCSKEEMVQIREKIKNEITNYMSVEGYSLSNNSKFTHTLDSFVFSYSTVSGSRDNLKVEINYSNRVHVLNTIFQTRDIPLGESVSTKMLSINELVGSKINALIVRTTPRDVYDSYNLLKEKTYDYNLIKKVAVFYVMLGSDIPVDFKEKFETCIKRIEDITYNKLRDNLIPLLHRSEKLDIENMKEYVIDRLKEIFSLNEGEKEFINDFNLGVFNQKALFENLDINDLSKHPMVIWKMNNIK